MCQAVVDELLELFFELVLLFVAFFLDRVFFLTHKLLDLGFHFGLGLGEHLKDLLRVLWLVAANDGLEEVVLGFLDFLDYVFLGDFF